MTDFPIELNIAELRPPNFTLRRLSEALVYNMSGVVVEGLMGATSEVEPVHSPGPSPKFDGGSWYSWKPFDHRFVPIDVRVQNVLLQATPTANRRQIFQNKDGVIALLDDTYGIRPTVILPEGLVIVDWDVGDSFLCVLSGNRKPAFYMFHTKPGMEIDILLVNNGTNQLVETWDPMIQWPAGTAPAMPAAPPGTSARQVVTLRKIGDTIYGEYVNYAGVALSYDAAQPLFIS